jgi:anti-sigma factor RsiW
LTRRRWLTGFLPLALCVSVLIGSIGFFGGALWNYRHDNQRIVNAVVAAHVRSLQVEHAVDVASSDRHTVKPWFQGKLDFAPLVIDLSNQGFHLHGGRLDYLTDRPVASIVFYRRAHPINVFTWPEATVSESAVRSTSAQGFHVRTWFRSGMVYWVISDLNDAELDQFVELLRTNDGQVPATLD